MCTVSAAPAFPNTHSHCKFQGKVTTIASIDRSYCLRWRRKLNQVITNFLSNLFLLEIPLSERLPCANSSANTHSMKISQQLSVLNLAPALLKLTTPELSFRFGTPLVRSASIPSLVHISDPLLPSSLSTMSLRESPSAALEFGSTMSVR